MNNTILSKRTNILFSQDMWGRLIKLSRKQSISVGELIRNAIQNVYFSDEEMIEKKRAYDAIIKKRPVFRGKIDYNALISEGRKY